MKGKKNRKNKAAEWRLPSVLGAPLHDVIASKGLTNA
jgi:hypothetical protein